MRTSLRLLTPCLFCAFLLATGQTWGSEPTRSTTAFDIPRMEQVLIDGKSDDWGEASFRVDLLMPAHQELKPVADHDARIRLAWNDDGLLVHVRVNDDEWVEHPEEDELQQWDVVELFLLPEQGAVDLCQWIIAPGMDPEQPEPRWRLEDHRKSKSLKRAPAKPSIARVGHDEEYVLEVLLPWQALAIEPEVGREVGFQLWVNDADERNGPKWYHAMWFPQGGLPETRDRVNRLRLSDKAGPSVAAQARGRHDTDHLRTEFTVFAPADQIGRNAEIQHNGATVATGRFEAEEGGRARTEMALRIAPVREPYGTFELRVDQNVGMLDVPDINRAWAEAFLFATPVALPAVFSGSELPEIRYKRNLWIESLIGPYELNTIYYDADYNVVETADTPGRYGAVVEIATEYGQTFRRFVTLYQQPERLSWWRHEMPAHFVLPPEIGVLPQSAALYPDAIANFIKWRVVDSFDRNSEGARLFAGLHETEQSETQNDFYSEPWQKDRQWWVGLKRKLYGWDERWPAPFVCPLPKEGEPAPVVRTGSLEEAGMKPDAAAQIDAVLTQWSNDSDEAFAVCVVRHGVIVLHKAYGTRDGEPMTVDTRSWMASITKMLSSILLLTFVDQGLVDLDDRVDKYLPPLEGSDFDKPLTIRHLYTHTSGLSWHWGAWTNDMEERLVPLFSHLEVGARYAYNGTGFDLGNKILEAVSGQSLPKLHRNHLLGPLGVDNTTIPDGGGGTDSVPLDMARIGQMLLNKGAYGSMRFMREETFEELLPRKLTALIGPQTEIEYGLGTGRATDEGLSEDAFTHGAASGATFRIDPGHDLVIVMTRNRWEENSGKYHQRFIDAIVAGISE